MSLEYSFPVIFVPVSFMKLNARLDLAPDGITVVPSDEFMMSWISSLEPELYSFSADTSDGIDTDESPFIIDAVSFIALVVEVVIVVPVDVTAFDMIEDTDESIEGNGISIAHMMSLMVVTAERASMTRTF